MFDIKICFVVYVVMVTAALFVLSKRLEKKDDEILNLKIEIFDLKNENAEMKKELARVN